MFFASFSKRRRNRLFVNGKSMNATTTETRSSGKGGVMGVGRVDVGRSSGCQMLCISDVDRFWCSGSPQKKPNEPSARKKKNTLTKKHVVKHRPCVGHLPKILQSLELKTQLFEWKLGFLATLTWHVQRRWNEVARTDEKSSGQLAACIIANVHWRFFSKFNNYSFDLPPPPSKMGKIKVDRNSLFKKVLVVTSQHPGWGRRSKL